MIVSVKSSIVTGRVVRVLAIILVASCYIMGSAEVHAKYVKRVVIRSGEDAPGIPGAKFSSVYWETPIPIGLSASGKVLFTANLEIGVGRCY